MKKEQGITLVALIITIIILLILAVVSVNIVAQEGIITKTQKAKDDYVIAQEKEKIQLGYSEYKMALASGEENAELKVDGADVEETDDGWDITFTETGHKYLLNSEGKISDPIAKTEEEIAFEKYVLGDKLEGQVISTIMNEDMTFKQLDGKDVEYLNFGPWNKKDDGMFDMTFYVKYNNKAYRIVTNTALDDSDDIDLAGGITKSATLVYTPDAEGKEGKTYAECGGTGEFADWIVLYNNGESLELVSPDSMGNLTLGSGDEQAQTPGDIDKDGVENTYLDKAIYSYNNAVKRINEYCVNQVKSIDSNINEKNIRSVGSNPNYPNSDNSGIFVSDKFKEENWNLKYGGREVKLNEANIKRGDNKYEKDFVRMSYWGIASTTDEYWLASRYVGSDAGRVDFGVDTVDEGGFYGRNLLDAYSDGGVYDSLYSRAVRPVVKINS